MYKRITIIGLLVVMIVAGIVLIKYRSEQLAIFEDDPAISALTLEDEIFETDDFSIILPAGWEGYQDFGQIFIAFKDVGSEDKMEDLMLMVETFPREGMDLDQLQASVEAGIASQEEGEAQVKLTEDRQVDGRPARYLEMEAQLEDQDLFRALVFVEDQEDFWGIFMDMPPESWSSQQVVFERVVESFKLN